MKKPEQKTKIGRRPNTDDNNVIYIQRQRRQRPQQQRQLQQ